MKLLYLVMVLWAFTQPAAAAELAGRWVLRADNIPIMAFDLIRTQQGWTGTFERPAQLETDGGEHFFDVSGPAVRRTARLGKIVPEGVELTFDDPQPGGMPDVLTFTPDGAALDVRWVAFAEPLALERSAAPLPPAWDQDRTYTHVIVRPTSAAMKAIFDADQADRRDPKSIDWRLVTPADQARRAQVQALLDRGELHSGDDFLRAAFVFQHGERPDDYLKAHALALVAVARGAGEATWIAAATLDRYLQSTGQPQVYGTQTLNRPDGPTQEPFQRDLLSDAIRTASHVPTLAEQQRQQDEQQRAREQPTRPAKGQP